MDGRHRIAGHHKTNPPRRTGFVGYQLSLNSSQRLSSSGLSGIGSSFRPFFAVNLPFAIEAQSEGHKRCCLVTQQGAPPNAVERC